MIAEALARVTAGETLERAAMRDLMRAIMAGEGEEDAIGALLSALHRRGETLDEIIGAAEAMRELAVPLPPAPRGAIDSCGTGGDRSGSFNISTVAALVVAGAGVPVAKHGNRSATSRCGSADVLEALGVRIDLPPERAAACVGSIGIGFLFARSCHPAMARVAPIRAGLEHPSLFNRLGPLTNPMRVRRQLVGISDAAHLEQTLEALVRLGSECAWVVHGEDGLDEISAVALTRVVACADGPIERFEIRPGEFVPAARSADLAGGDAQTNARIASEILAGESGSRRDVVLLNAGAALRVAGRAGDLAAGIEQAAESIDSGRARDLLRRWIEFTAGEGGA